MERPAKLINRNFMLLWQGQTISMLGSQAFAIGMLLWIKETTGSASLMGILLMVSNLPGVIVGLVGGAVADRHSRRTVIVVSDLLRGLAVLSLAGMLFFAPWATTTILIWLFTVSVFVAVTNAFFRPAMQAAIPDLVPPHRLTSANSLVKLSAQLTTFVGQGLGGVIFRILGAPWMFLIDGVSYLFAATSASFATIPQDMPEKSPGWYAQFASFKRDLAAGLRYVWQKPGLRELLFVAAYLNFFGVPILVLLPFYVEDSLHLTIDWYGYALATFGLGAVAGYLSAGSITPGGKTRSVLIVLSIVILSASYGLLGFTPVPIVALALAFVAGAMNGFVNVYARTIVQMITPADMRGRVFGLLNTLAVGLTPLAMGLSGVVADLVNQNIPLIYRTCGGIALALSLLVVLNERFRALLAYEDEETPVPMMKERIAS